MVGSEKFEIEVRTIDLSRNVKKFDKLLNEL